MPDNFVAHTKKLCSRLSSNEVQFYTKKGRFACLSLPLGSLGATTMFILGSLESAKWTSY